VNENRNAPEDLRTRRRNETSREVIETALTLFRTTGFSRTTVDDIARAVGISERTFFRYFRTKEDVLLVGSTEFDLAVEQAELGSSLASGLEAIERICAEHLEQMIHDHGDLFARTQRLIAAEPAVSAALYARQHATSVSLRERLLASAATTDELSAQLVVELAYAALRSAIETWSRDPDAVIADLPEIYLRAREQSRALLATVTGPPA
jgi:AcrR family transcriptional regulator